MHYICIEIWEKPKLLLFFGTFPLKTGFWERSQLKFAFFKFKFASF